MQTTFPRLLLKHAAERPTASVLNTNSATFQTLVQQARQARGGLQQVLSGAAQLVGSSAGLVHQACSWRSVPAGHGLIGIHRLLSFHETIVSSSSFFCNSESD